MKKFFENKPRAWFTVGAILVGLLTVSALVAGYFYSEKDDGKTLVIVGSEKITTDELSEALYGFNFDEDASFDEDVKNQVLDRLIEREIVSKESEKMGISVTDEEVETATRERLGEQFNEYTEEQKKQTRETVRYSLLIKKVSARLNPSAQVSFLLARFDRTRQEYEDGWQEKMSEDKVYAEKLINQVYQDLKSGKLNTDSAKKLLDEDKRLGKNAWKYPQNMVFSEEMSIKYSDEIYHSEKMVKDTLALTKGLNEPLVANVRYDEDGDSMDSFFYIPYVEQINQSGTNYETWLNEKYNEYNVRRI